MQHKSISIREKSIHQYCTWPVRPLKENTRINTDYHQCALTYNDLFLKQETCMFQYETESIDYEDCWETMSFQHVPRYI